MRIYLVHEDRLKNSLFVIKQTKGNDKNLFTYKIFSYHGNQNQVQQPYLNL